MESKAKSPSTRLAERLLFFKSGRLDLNLSYHSSLALQFLLALASWCATRGRMHKIGG